MNYVAQFIGISEKTRWNTSVWTENLRKGLTYLTHFGISFRQPFALCAVPGGGSGVLPKKLGRGVRPAFKPLTLFMTKIWDFPLPYLWPFLWPDQKFDTLFMTWYPFSYQNGGKLAKIDTLFMTKTAENHTFWDRTYIYSPYKGVPPDAVTQFFFVSKPLRYVSMKRELTYLRYFEILLSSTIYPLIL